MNFAKIVRGHLGCLWNKEQKKLIFSRIRILGKRMRRCLNIF